MSQPGLQTLIWRRFLLALVGSFAGVTLALFAFAAIVDPWDALSFSPALKRLPITSNSPYALPMLARSPTFDSAVIGDSTSRLLRPAVLDPLLGARFVNLSFFAATAYEQARMLRVFLEGHPHPRFIMIGLDIRWCDPAPQPPHGVIEFPEWLYEPKSWRGYRHMLSLFALREAASQAQAILGRGAPRHGLDGYTDFELPDSVFLPDAVHARIIGDGLAPAWPDPQAPASSWQFTTHGELQLVLKAIPAGTGTLLFFVPFARSYQGTDDSPTQAYWQECKRRVAAVAAARPDTRVADFSIDSSFSRDEANFFDAVHYRRSVAARLAADLARAANAKPAANGDFRLLTP